MKTLDISWQRLVQGGRTCPRCGDTGAEIRKAVATLTPALAPMGIEVRLTESQLSADEFGNAPLESNRITLLGRDLEEWVGGETGQSQCCDVCGDNDCRTVNVAGETYETIPADMVVRAGLLAAADLLAGPAAQTGDCCEPTTQADPVSATQTSAPSSACCG